MYVMCSKKHIVPTGTCGNCPDYEKPDPDNKWGNSGTVCKFFRYVVKTKQEEDELNAKMLYPGTNAHEKASKKMAENEDRDLDKLTKKRFPIAVSYDVPVAKRKIGKGLELK